MKIILAFLFLTALGGCASSSEIDNMKQSIQKRLDEIESRVNNQKLVELYRMTEENKELVVRMQGDIETIQYDLRNIKKRQEDLYSDLDSRISNQNTELAQQYEEAIELIKKKSFNQALSILKKIAQYAEQKKQAPETHFWIAIAYTGLGDLNSAIGAYKKFVAENPTHEKAPDALFNIAHCQEFLHQETEKKATVEKLLRFYSNSDAAKRAKLTFK